MTRSPTHTHAISSPGIAQAVQDYIDGGWAEDVSHTAPLFLEMHPGFRAEADYNSPEDIARMRVHAEFMDPRGLIAGAASVMQGAADHIMHFSLEGFPSHAAAKAAVPLLDSLRPDLARALSLFAIARSRSQAVVDSLALVGVGAAVVGRDGVLRAANDHFVQRLEDQLIDGRSGLRFADAFLQTSLSLALARHVRLKRGVQSVAIRSKDGARPCALHLLPIVGAAQEMCEADGILLLLSDPENRAVPSGDLLRLMFDLTPAEARLARALTEGESLAGSAHKFGTSELTTKTQLRTIFGKTGTSKQAELILLLTGIAPPSINSAWSSIFKHKSLQLIDQDDLNAPTQLITALDTAQ